MPEPKINLPNLINQDLISFFQGRMESRSLEEFDWNGFLATIEVEGLAGICYDSLRSSKISTLVPLDVMVRLEEAYRKTQVKNVLLREGLRVVLARMHASSIPVIILKGAALSELAYGDIGLRQMCDLDLLVRPDHADQAVSILQEADFERISKPELQSGFDRLFRVEVELRTPPPYQHQVEIHWQLLAPLFACRFVDLLDVWDRATPVNIVGQPAYTLGPEDWVLHLIAHAFYKHRRIGLQVLFDVDRLVRYLDQRLDWDELLEIGECFHWLPALAAVLPKCVELLGTPIPERVMQSTLVYKVPRLEGWMLAWWMNPKRSGRFHIFPDWLTLPSFGARLRVLWAYIFPGRTYMEALYPSRSTWRLPFVYIQRWRSEIRSR